MRPRSQAACREVGVLRPFRLGVRVEVLDEGSIQEDAGDPALGSARAEDRKSTRLNSSHSQISYAVFCLKKKKRQTSSRCAVGHWSARPSQSLHDFGALV